METPRISPQAVAERIRGGEQVVFLDARSPTAFEQATDQIPGSIRVPPGETDEHLAELPGGDPLVVAYCT